MVDSFKSYNSGYGNSGDAQLGKYYVRLTLGDYKRRKPFDQAKMEPKKYIYLPLPMEMRDDTVTGYGNVDQGLVGNIMDSGIDNSANYAAEALRQSGSVVKDVSGSLTSLIGRIPVIGGTAQRAIDNSFSAEQLTSALSQQMGVSPNPNPAVIFQGPKLRDFNLNWMLMPTNQKESSNVRNLVNTLKASTLPKNTVKDSAAILEYPNLVKINFYPWDSGGQGAYGWTDKSIIRMKHCFMASVNVNYTAGNIPAFFEGSNEPVVVGLSINFVETEYFLSNDYDNTVNSSAADGLLDLFDEKLRQVAGDILGDEAETLLSTFQESAE